MELPVVKNFLTVLQKLLPARNYRQLTLTGGPLLLIRHPKIVILNLLDTFEILFKEGLWFLFRMKL